MLSRARGHVAAAGLLIVLAVPHAQLRAHSLEAGHAFDAGHFGQIDVHQNDVGPVGRHLLQGGLRIGISADAPHLVTAVQEDTHALAQARIVFDNGDFDGHGRRLGKAD